MEGTWILAAEADHRFGLRPCDVEYFQTHFISKPMADDWKPSSYEIRGKTLPIRDFLSWMLQVPVISEKARKALFPIITEHCEILPLIHVRRKQYYAVNVLTQVDCLDQGRCDILYSPTDPNRILNISQFFFIKDRVPQDVPLFKVPQDNGVVFATRRFIDFVAAHQLRGAQFLNPAINPFVRIAMGPQDGDLYFP